MNHFIDQVRPASSIQNQTFHNWSQLALTHLTFLHLLMWSSIPGRLYELQHCSIGIGRLAHHLFQVYFIECFLCTWHYVLCTLCGTTQNMIPVLSNLKYSWEKHQTSCNTVSIYLKKKKGCAGFQIDTWSVCHPHLRGQREVPRGRRIQPDIWHLKY